jgi:hypothetical protein
MELSEDEDSSVNTQFEEQWKAIDEDVDMISNLRELDVLSGIGQFGGLLLGYDDAPDDATQQQEAAKGAELKYVRPFHQGSIDIRTTVEDASSPRFGLPETYAVDFNYGEDSSKSVVYHWTRFVGVAHNKTSDPFKGESMLSPVYNRLQDLELIAGGSAEMYWRGGFPGYNFKLDPELTNLTDADKADFKEQIQNYFQGLQRYLRTRGVTAEALEQQISDPKSLVDVEVSLISAATGIPKRKLLGSERGELASTQDQRTWADRVKGYRTRFSEPDIIKPVVAQLIYNQTLIEPASWWTTWTDDTLESPTEKYQSAKLAAEAIGMYVNNGLDLVMSFEMFATQFLGVSKDTAQTWSESITNG